MSLGKRLALAAASLFTVLSLGLAVAPAAGAVDVFSGVCDNSTGVAKSTDVCKDKASTGSSNPIINTLKLVINIMSFVVGVAAVIVLIIAAITMTTSGGDAQQVAEARRSMIYALVGIAIAVMAKAIVSFVLNKT